MCTYTRCVYFKKPENNSPPLATAAGSACKSMDVVPTLFNSNQGRIHKETQCQHSYAHDFMAIWVSFPTENSFRSWSQRSASRGKSPSQDA